MTKEKLDAIELRLDALHSNTVWNHMNGFEPKVVDDLVKHLKRCHDIINEFAAIPEYLLPFRGPDVIKEANKLRKDFECAETSKP